MCLKSIHFTFRICGAALVELSLTTHYSCDIQVILLKYNKSRAEWMFVLNVTQQEVISNPIHTHTMCAKFHIHFSNASQNTKRKRSRLRNLSFSTIKETNENNGSKIYRGKISWMMVLHSGCMMRAMSLLSSEKRKQTWKIRRKTKKAKLSDGGSELRCCCYRRKNKTAYRTCCIFNGRR